MPDLKYIRAILRPKGTDSENAALFRALAQEFVRAIPLTMTVALILIVIEWFSP